MTYTIGLSKRWAIGIYFQMTAVAATLSLVRFRDEFPERFINVGIAEQNMIGIEDCGENKIFSIKLMKEYT